MDVIHSLSSNAACHPIQCVDMHTTGEPTRIVISGHPELQGTLLEQRAQARSQYDYIRQRLLLEPRGHRDMYGAILRPTTELVQNGTAHIGVLFMTNEGYSTMCGHATIALGRFLFDTRDLQVFPNRNDIQIDKEKLTAQINLHPPCGLVEVTVPVTADGKKSDPSRPVSFVCVPSFATGVGVTIDLEPQFLWPELRGRTKVQADFCYGGAFSCVVEPAELGFVDGLRQVDLEAMNRATRLLKAAINADPQYKHLFRHPDHEDLGFLYTVMVEDKNLGVPSSGAAGAETGLCYFDDQQIDRSPTGSAVAAREALAVAKGERTVGQKWTYHSLVSVAHSGKGGFDAEVVEVQKVEGAFPLVRVRVSGKAFYTGASTFFVEEDDILGRGGFVFEKLAAAA